MSEPCTLLAFDVGQRKTGVAVGNSLSRDAQALTIIRTDVSALRLSQVAKIVGEWQPGALVVGLPSHPDGQALPNTALCQKFGRQLTEKFRLPVHFVDERLSTHEASQILRERGEGGSRARSKAPSEDDDAEAAAVILRQYWAEHPES